MRLLPGLILTLVLLALPASAGAAVRLAVPAGGAGSGACDAAAPCTLEQAIAGASANDTVRVAAGTYAFATPLSLTAGGLAVEGDPAGAPPLLQWTGSPDAGAVFLGAYGQTLRRLRVEGAVNGAHVLVRTNGTVGNATLDRVEVRNAGSGTAVALRASLLHDSVVTSTGAGGIAAIATGTVTSSTLIADGLGGQALCGSTVFFGGAAAVRVRNTILRGAASGWDGVAEDNDGVDGTAASLDVDSPSFGARRLDTRGADAAIVAGTANITTVGPLLAGLPGGADVHQLRGGLTPGTTYHVRIVGSSAKGTTNGPDVTFRTTTSPLASRTGARPRITSASLARRSVRRGKPASLHLRSSQVGTLEIAIARLRRGHRSGGACVAASRRCTAAVRVKALSRRVLSGGNGPFPIITSGLRRGRYRLTLALVSGDGKRSRPVALALRVR